MSLMLIDQANAFSDACEPFADVPAWWSGFLFHVLNPRQVTTYMYLNMIADSDGMCHPTSTQIRDELGLSSLTMVFDALSELVDRGFILRERRAVRGLPSRRNVYQRPSCEFTILRLLQRGDLDGSLCAADSAPMSKESWRLKERWLEHTLRRDYKRFTATAADDKRALLIQLLTELVGRD